MLRVGEGPEFNLVVPRNDFDFVADLKEQLCDVLLIDFIRKCLEMDPAQRLKVEDALKHPFVLKTFN